LDAVRIQRPGGPPTWEDVRVKADPAVQRRLLELAEVDAVLDRTNHRRRTLPELAEIAAAERDEQGKRDAVVAAETSLGDLDREVRRMETDVDQVRAREDRDRKLLDSVTSARQLEDLQHELASLERRQSALEDDLLELMERREATERQVKHAREELTAAEENLTEAGDRRDRAVVDLETTAARRDEERKALLTGLPADLVTLYERVRAQRGIGAALLRYGRCGACRLELDRTALSRLHDAAADEVARCDECGAILVRTAESGL
jgi:predicted  nucleic acid-binding Zn-ribbon protein